jgi:nucleotide-binding universal stress UspA family protein
MFKRILVPLDGSPRAESALPVAARLARAADGTIILLNVITAAEGAASSAREPFITYQIQEKASAWAIKYLADVASSQQWEGIATHVVVDSGPAAKTILETVEEQHADLIIMTTRGETGFKRWAVGSVTLQVARQCAVPVLALRAGGMFPTSAYPDASRPLHPVTAIVALDGEELAEETIGPAAQVVAALTSPAPGILHLTRVVQLPNIEYTLQEQQRKMRDEALNEAAEYLSNVTADLHEQLEHKFHLTVTWSVVADTSIPHGLMMCAEEGRTSMGTFLFGGGDLLSIATHGRSGLSRLMLGSVSESLLGKTKLPLLIVRPGQVSHSTTG